MNVINYDRTCLYFRTLLEIYWKLAKSPGDFLAEFVCLLLYDAKFLYQ